MPNDIHVELNKVGPKGCTAIREHQISDVTVIVSSIVDEVDATYAAATIYTFDSELFPDDLALAIGKIKGIVSGPRKCVAFHE